MHIPPGPGGFPNCCMNARRRKGDDEEPRIDIQERYMYEHFFKQVAFGIFGAILHIKTKQGYEHFFKQKAVGIFGVILHIKTKQGYLE